MKNVDTCATAMPNGSVHTQMGTIASTSFVSSTCVTVASRHGPKASSPAPGSTMAALSRNLQDVPYVTLNNRSTAHASTVCSFYLLLGDLFQICWPRSSKNG